MGPPVQHPPLHQQQQRPPPSGPLLQWVASDPWGQGPYSSTSMGVYRVSNSTGVHSVSMGLRQAQAAAYVCQQLPLLPL